MGKIGAMSEDWLSGVPGLMWKGKWGETRTETVCIAEWPGNSRRRSRRSRRHKAAQFIASSTTLAV